MNGASYQHPETARECENPTCSGACAHRDEKRETLAELEKLKARENELLRRLQEIMISEVA